MSGFKILDVGSGSGWTSALLAHIVSTNGRGKVYAMELLPELCTFGKKNIEKYHFIEKGTVAHFCKDATQGLPEYAPFDRLIAAAAAAAETFPEAWLGQLKPGGRLVAPVQSNIWLYTKNKAGEISRVAYPGFAFVPLVTPS